MADLIRGKIPFTSEILESSFTSVSKLWQANNPSIHSALEAIMKISKVNSFASVFTASKAINTLGRLKSIETRNYTGLSATKLFQTQNLQSLQKIFQTESSFLTGLSTSPLASGTSNWTDTMAQTFKSIGISKPNNVSNLLLDQFNFIDYNLSEDIILRQKNEQLAAEERSPIIFLDEVSRVKRIIADIYYDNGLLNKIEPREFEEIVAEMLRGKGFKVELTKQTRDNGYDLLAISEENGFPLKYLVECKRYAERRKIGVDIVRGFKEVVESENANKGIIVTTSYFTKDARDKKEKTPYLLDYRDKDDVINWVSEYFKASI
jgi:HJR/Mrr/RecB family endonuclease